MSVKQRLIEFISYKKISIRAFEKAVGLSNGYVNNISVSIKYEKMQMISLRFPELNPVWLMMGEGEMILTETSSPEIPVPKNLLNEPAENYEPRFDLEAIEALNNVIKKMSERYNSVCQDNERLREDNKSIRNENDVFRVENDRLRSKINELKKTIDAQKGTGEGAAHA